MSEENDGGSAVATLPTETTAVLQKGVPFSTKINRLVMDGFKSFGKRVEMVFGDSFNVVLGPNGSGKSNVIDALCFVLGKSSSKKLRAEKSSNLIYNGGKNRNPGKSAEVSIFFDNKDKTFPVDEDEVKVSRIVNAKGQSKYRINNKTTTRQEVLELLGVARINPDGYNIILQGDIVKLVEMSPVERRMIVEEIAGIGVYEEKKQQALKDLEKVEQKIGEADIVLKERKGYLKDLKKDRDQAMKYKELSDGIKKNKASFLKRRIDVKEKEKATLEERSGKYKEKLEKINVQVQNMREDIKAKRETIKAITQEIEEKGETEQVRRQKELESMRIEIATEKTKHENMKTERNRVQQRRSQLVETAGDIQAKQNKLKEQKEETKDAERALKKKIEELEATMSAFKKKNGLGEESAAVEHQMAELDGKAEKSAEELHKLREQQQNFLREKDKIDFQLQTIDEQIAKVEGLAQENKQEIDVLKKKKNQFKKLIMELNTLLNTDSEQAAALAKARQRTVQLREEITKLELKNMKVKEMVAQNRAVQKIIDNKAKLGGVHGTVAELGQADSKYAAALDVAAGNKLQSIVVDDDKTAASCIAFLKKNQLGVAAFLPLNKVKPVKASESTKALTKEKGVHGLAIDLVQFDPKFRNAFSHVFGNTLIVDSLAAARKLGVGKMRMVTIDGDLCESSGAMIGGFRLKKARVFREKGVTEKIEKATVDLADLEKKIKLLETSREELEEKITKQREVKANLEGDIIKSEKALHLDSSDLDASTKYKEELKVKSQEIEKDLEKLDDELVEKTQGLTEIKLEKEKIRQQITELRNPRVLAELNAYEQKHREMREELIKYDVELKNMNAQLNQGVLKEHENAQKVLEDLDNEVKEYDSKIKSAIKIIERQEKEANEKDKELQKFYAKNKTMFEKRNKIMDETTKLENSIYKKEDEARKEEIQINTYSVEEARVKAELSALLADFQQYEGVEVDEKKPIDQLKKEIQEFERLMANIGAVNLRSLDIYDAAEKEFNVLVEKKEVLATEKNTVLDFMEQIELKKTDLFMNTLQVVNNNFKEIFGQLSTKGDADLELLNPEQPFEDGLRIKVKIAGEKFLDIRSLSGGEKTLTALAFLFAIQEHEPASFYVLDEVDAALDKHNSEKLAKLIRKYCDGAQYVVISHNDAVITEGDTLFGVSMNEHTMSKIVSLRV